MKHVKLITLMLSSLILLVGCDNPPEPAVAPSVEKSTPVKQQTDSVANEEVLATILEFDEVEAGVDPYKTRMTITGRFIRIDDSEETDGFVLFDREKKRIFSVVHSSESILVVDPVKPLQEVPDDLKIRAELLEDDAMPKIAGVQPSYFQFYANEQLCYHLVAVPGFLPDITSALQSYRMVLAAQQQETLLITPPELQTPCFLANYIYASHLYMSKGFPIEQWDVTGYRRSFSGVEENAAVAKSLFTLPEQYQFMSIGGGNLQM